MMEREATGAIEAVVTVDVSSQLSGRIADVYVSFNDAVKAGQYFECRENCIL